VEELGKADGSDVNFLADPIRRIPGDTLLLEVGWRVAGPCAVEDEAFFSVLSGRGMKLKRGSPEKEIEVADLVEVLFEAS